MPLRPYQESFIKQALPSAWREGHRAIVAVAPGAAGKTEIAVSTTEIILAQDFKLPLARQFDVMFLAGRTELIEQPYRRYLKRGIRAGIIKAGVKPDPLARVQIASVKTIINRVITVGLRRRIIVFVDEFHHVKADEWLGVISAIKQSYDEVYIIGLTATPYRGDHQGLGDVATKLIEVTTPRKLAEEGWILIPKFFIDEESAKIINSVQTNGEFDASAVDNRPKLIANIVDTWKKESQGAPGIGFAINVAHSKHIVERLIANGIRAAHLDGTTPKGERRRLLARLAIGGQASEHPEALDVISNCDVLTEGFDSESSYEMVSDLAQNPDMKDLWLGRSYPPPYRPLENIGDWAPTKSMGKRIQREVRTCRIHADKRGARYFDHAGNIARTCRLIDHEGFTLDDGSDKVKKSLVPVGGKYISLKCLRCNIDLPPEAIKCPDCGCEQVGSGSGPGRVVEEAPGELVEAKGEVVGVRKQLPHEQIAELRTRMVEWKFENERRVAQGKAPYKWGWVLKQYEQAFRQVADGKVVGRIRKEFGV